MRGILVGSSSFSGEFVRLWTGAVFMGAAGAVIIRGGCH